MRFESRAHSGFEPARHVKPWTDGAAGCMAALQCHGSKGAGIRRTPVGIALMFLDFGFLRLTSRPNQFLVAPKGLTQAAPQGASRSEERRVGNECVRTCRSRVPPEHK